MTDFDEQQVAERLRSRAEEIAARRAQLRRSEEGMLDSELADYDQHPADQGTETFEQELDETTDMMLANELEQVELALRRLDEGQYGICIDCGKEIEPARLEAEPWAVRCLDDQKRYEATLRARWPPPPRDVTP